MRERTRRVKTSVLLLLAGALLPVWLQAAPGGVVDVCQAARLHGALVVRGTGQMMEEGLTLASMACPLAGTERDPLPTMILVRVERFATEELRGLFRGAETHRGPYSPVFEVEVRGELRCQARMKLIRNGKKVVGAHGFGGFGLDKCVLEAGELVSWKEARVQPVRRGVMRPTVPNK